MAKLKRWARYVFGVLFILAGANHFRATAFYVSIIPDYLPWHLQLVYMSGAAEIALGVLLFFRRFASLAAWGTIALMVAVFPANLQMALHSERYPQFDPAMLWWRLPLQALLIAFAYWLTRRTCNARAPDAGIRRSPTRS